MSAGPGDALPEERQREILRRLNSHGRVVAAALAIAFAVSEDSIRRDLRELAARGLCRRVYGGALLVGPDLPPVSLRRGQQVETKLLLARKAVSLVRSGQTLLIDAGSTNSAIADALAERMDLTIVTTAPDIAQRLMDRQGFEILMIGGCIDKRAGSAVGTKKRSASSSWYISGPNLLSRQPDSFLSALCRDRNAIRQSQDRM